MKLSESQLRNFIRQQIKEMAYAGRLNPTFGRSDDISVLAGEVFDYGPEEDQKQLKPDVVARYAMSQTFEKLAKKHFANIPWNVWFAPLIGTYYEAVQDTAALNRAILEPLNPDGISRLKSLGYEIPENISADDVIILYTSTILEKNFIATPWMIVHSIFDNYNLGVFSKTYVDKIYPLLRYNQNTPHPGTEILKQENFTNFYKSWINALTMKSARTRLVSYTDAFPEIMCQELLTRNGFTINDSGAEQEYIDALYSLKPVIKQCANEFNSNIRGKLIITAVN